MRALTTAGLALAMALTATGCGGQIIAGQPVPFDAIAADQPLIDGYFDKSNTAARNGAAAQREFLANTQHPDFGEPCELGELTLLLEPAMSTLRLDDGWRPERTGERPRGRVYAIAVTVTVQRDRATLGTQIGSMHIVVLAGNAYGFAPCPR